MPCAIVGSKVEANELYHPMVCEQDIVAFPNMDTHGYSTEKEKWQRVLLKMTKSKQGDDHIADGQDAD